MKVILKQDVKGLGKKDSIVEASDGYAKNFLFPKGLAVEASNKNVNEMEAKNKSKKIQKEKEIAQAKELAERIGKMTLIIKAKVGEGSKLFGSITSKDIAEMLKKDHKTDIDKKKIVLNEPIKALGVKEVEIKLYQGVTANLTVKIEGE